MKIWTYVTLSDGRTHRRHLEYGPTSKTPVVDESKVMTGSEAYSEASGIFQEHPPNTLVMFDGHLMLDTVEEVHK